MCANYALYEKKEHTTYRFLLFLVLNDFLVIIVTFSVFGISRLSFGYLLIKSKMYENALPLYFDTLENKVASILEMNFIHSKDNRYGRVKPYSFCILI